MRKLLSRLLPKLFPPADQPPVFDVTRDDTIRALEEARAAQRRPSSLHIDASMINAESLHAVKQATVSARAARDAPKPGETTLPPDWRHRHPDYSKD